MRHARKLSAMLSVVLIGCEGAEEPPEAAVQRISQPQSFGEFWECDASRMPGPNQVAIFQNSNYGGKCYILDLPSDPAQRTPRGYPVGFGLGNDSISSLKVGSNVYLSLFENSWFGGRTASYFGNSSSLGWSNDLASSLRITAIERKCWGAPLQSGEVVLYEGANFTGDCELWKRSDDPQGWGKGVLPRIDEDANFQNDSVSSIRVGPATVVSLYRNTWFTDAGYNISTDVAQLSATAFGNDKLSSFIIRQ